MFNKIRALIEPLRSVEAPSVHHPESNVLNHTCQVVLEAGRRCQDVVEPMAGRLILAAALHDVGKPVSIARDGTTHGHEGDSVKLIEPLFGPEHDVVWLVKNHLRIMNVDQMRESKRKALTEDSRFDTLRVLRECDVAGRKAEFIFDRKAEDAMWFIIELWANEYERNF